MSTDFSLPFAFTAEGEALGTVRLPADHLGCPRRLRRDLRTQGVPSSMARDIAQMIADVFGDVPIDMLSDINGDIRVELSPAEDEA